MKRKIIFWWTITSLYINLKGLFLQVGVFCLGIALMSWASGDSFFLYGIPILLFFTVFAIWMKVYTQVLPTHREVLEEIDLEAKYAFMYERFTRMDKY